MESRHWRCVPKWNRLACLFSTKGRENPDENPGDTQTVTTKQLGLVGQCGDARLTRRSNAKQKNVGKRESEREKQQGGERRSRSMRTSTRWQKKKRKAENARGKRRNSRRESSTVSIIGRKKQKGGKQKVRKIHSSSGTNSR